MKRIIFFISLLVSVGVFAQDKPSYYIGLPGQTAHARGNLRADSTFLNPLRDTTFTPWRLGLQVFRPGDSSLYVSTSLMAARKWTKLGSAVAGPAWGTITGTLSSQADLAAALAAKQDLLTTGTTSDYFRGDFSLSNFSADVTAITDALYSPLGHTHSGLVPLGGLTGQILKKNSNTDYDYSWQNEGTGYVAVTRTITINGVTYDLSADRTWTLATGGSTNSNIGSFYRWAVPGTNNIKTFANGYGVLLDSTTNTNALTAKVDTTILFPLLIRKKDSSVTYVTPTDLNALPTPTLQQVTDAGNITTNSAIFTHLITVNGDNNSAAAKLNTDNFGGTDAGGVLELKTLFSNYWATISPINSYSATHYYKLAQNGNGSGTDTVATLADVRTGGGGSTPRIDQLLAATATNTINNANYQQEWQWNSLTGNGLVLSSSSTTAVHGQTVLNINTGGANSNSNLATYGLQVGNTHTGTLSENYGVYATATGASTANIAIQGSSPDANGIGVYGSSSLAGVGIQGFNSSTGDGGYFFNSSTGYALRTGSGKVKFTASDILSNNGADTLATKAYARSLAGGGGSANIANASLTADGNYWQHWSGHHLKFTNFDQLDFKSDTVSGKNFGISDTKTGQGIVMFSNGSTTGGADVSSVDSTATLEAFGSGGRYHGITIKPDSTKFEGGDYRFKSLPNKSIAGTDSIGIYDVNGKLYKTPSSGLLGMTPTQITKYDSAIVRITPYVVSGDTVGEIKHHFNSSIPNDTLSFEAPAPSNLDMQNYRIVNLANPSDPTDAVNLQTTQNLITDAINGVSYKAAVQYATIAALSTNTYSNGTSGVGATITKTTNGALSVDGSTPSVGDRILVKNETTDSHNGIYTVTTVGSGAAPFVLTRAADYDQSGDISQGSAVYVVSGASISNTSWYQTTSGSITVGTTPIDFTQFAGAGTFTAGTNIDITGSTISVINAPVFSGNVTANSFIKTSGTSSQFLKADGSTDANAYLTTSSASSTYVPLTRTVNGKALSSNITLGLASSDFVNQGTTTTVLHGNASGNPSFGQIVNADITNSTIDLTTKVTGLLPDGNISSASAWNNKAASGANTDITSVLLNQTGLVVKGATSNALTIKPNETLTAGRTLNIVTGDASRTLTFSGDATISGTHSGTSSGTNTGDQTISITGDVTASGSTGALSATVTKINGTSLAGLATGILKNTTTTGVPSIAVAGTDYVAPGGALGTPSSGTLTNATGLPISTGVSGLGTNVATFLGTPSSANLRAALTDENGTGAALFNGATTPDFTTGFTIGAAASSGKIMKANGTNFVPSTETYAAPGTSGNIMVSDGTNWTSAARYPQQVATADIAATASATSTSTLFTPSADGVYRITCYMKITTTGTSPVAGPVTITYTDADGSVPQSHTMLLQSTTGTVVTTTVNNSTTTGTVNGSMVVNAKSGVAIQYAIAVSGTFGSGRYTAHFTCERIK